MKVLFVSHEVSPFAKVGGLADVAGSLPKALKALGHDVRVVMPAYKMVEDDPRWDAQPVGSDFTVSVNPLWQQPAYVKQVAMDEVPVYLLGTNEWFKWTVSSQTVYLPGSAQHLFFCRGVLEMVKQLDWIPDVIHCNDWHTGLIPLLMRETADRAFDRVASVYTIHNLAYQGEFGVDILDALGLPHHLYNMHQLEAYGSVNFLKSGCVFADQVNTVSPQYADEIQTPEFGCGLAGLMCELSKKGKLHGILNGIDRVEFDPATDENLPAHFTAEEPNGKAECKKALLAELGLPDDGAPLAGVVSRLSSQKGMDLMIEAAEQMFGLPLTLVVQGLGDTHLAEQYEAMQKQYPNRFRFIQKFDADLAQRIYAASDLFLMPSAFEPCGLGQMIALRYGTVPVVRKTGGLADTIFEGRNGFVFEEKTSADFLAACSRAVEAYKVPSLWTDLVHRALSEDFGWSKSAKHYETLYERAIESRKRVSACVSVGA